MIKICEECKKEFKTYNKNSKFCSKECLYQNRKLKQSINISEEIGKKYNKLTVLKLVKKEQIIRKKDGRKSGYNYFVLCFCECGGTAITEIKRLKNGKTKSCGCANKEQIKKVHLKNKKHGLSEHRLYKIWSAMIERCRNKNVKTYKNYGGRNIKVTKEWNNFINFYNWSINNGYNDKLSIDRINNNGNYEPNNCRWATAKQQANNRRTNKSITYNNETHSVAEWSEIKGINYDTLWNRLFRKHWTIEKSLVNNNLDNRQFKILFGLNREDYIFTD